MATSRAGLSTTWGLGQGTFFLELQVILYKCATESLKIDEVNTDIRVDKGSSEVGDKDFSEEI